VSAEEQGFGLHQAKQAVLDAINSEGVSDANKASLNSTLGLLRRLETVVVSEGSPAGRVSQLLKLLGMQSSKRGVHFRRDHLLVELVSLMALERGLDKPDVTLFQQAGHHAAISHERSIEKIWTDFDGRGVLASYRAQAEGNKSHWTTDKAIIREQIRLITNLLSEVTPKS
jgi:hypothetical protein